MHNTYCYVKAVALALVALLTIAGCSTVDKGKPMLFRVPDGYQITQAAFKAQRNECTVFTPDIGNLLVPSKYEGSGKDRATLNEESNERYQQLTQSINDFASYVASISRRVQRGQASKDTFECWLNNLAAWAEAKALLPDEINMTGKAVQKWTLATLASHYLVLQPLIPANDKRAKKIESWFDLIADQVIQHYSNRPLRKINNHDYWAAWSVLNVAVITQDDAKFNFSLSVFDTAMAQINEQGLLPNELKRESRAFSYHNYAMLPLASLAGLLNANNVDFTQTGRTKIFNLAEQILKPEPLARFTRYTGTAQKEYILDDGSHLAWVAALASVSKSNAEWMQYLYLYPDWQSHRYSRLGTGGCNRYPCAKY